MRNKVNISFPEYPEGARLSINGFDMERSVDSIEVDTIDSGEVTVITIQFSDGEVDQMTASGLGFMDVIVDGELASRPVADSEIVVLNDTEISYYRPLTFRGEQVVNYFDGRPPEIIKA